MEDDNTLLIMLTATVTVAITEFNAVNSGKNPTMKPVLAGFAMGIFLFGTNIISSELTKALCVLIILSSILINGAPIIKKLGAI